MVAARRSACARRTPSPSGRWYHNQGEVQRLPGALPQKRAGKLDQARTCGTERSDPGAGLGDQHLQPRARGTRVLTMLGVVAIVGVLEGDAVGGAVAGEGGHHLGGGAGSERADLQRRLEERGRLLAM